MSVGMLEGNCAVGYVRVNGGNFYKGNVGHVGYEIVRNVKE